MTETVDQAADRAGCSPRQFRHRARAAGVQPLHYVRVGGRMRPVFAVADVDAVIGGGQGSALAFDRVAVELCITSAALAAVVTRHCAGGSLAVPARYRQRTVTLASQAGLREPSS